MRICIFGAGATGGYLGVRLGLAGYDVSLVARGPHLEAMRSQGLRLRTPEGREERATLRCSDEAASLGPQDVVVVTLKAHSVAPALPALRSLLGPDTTVVTASNGVPWWYFYRLAGPLENTRLESVDPGGVLWEGIGPERVLGAVVYPATEVVEPGVIQHRDGDRLVLGEPSGEKSTRVTQLADALIEAGLRAPVRDIRHELWVKLWGNVSFNPISALTLATLEDIAGDEACAALARAVMVETQTVAEALGVRFRIDVDRRLRGAAAVGAHRTSMLQDLERGRPLETDAIAGAVQEMARLCGVDTPNLDTVLALLRLRERAPAPSSRQ